MKIASWKEQHLPDHITSSSKSVTLSADHGTGSLCKHNQIFCVLGLCTLEMEDFDLVVVVVCCVAGGGGGDSGCTVPHHHMTPG